MNYLDQTGLAYFWDKIKQHVTDEVTPIKKYNLFRIQLLTKFVNNN